MFDFLDDIINSLNDLLPGDLLEGLDLVPEDAASFHDASAAQIAADPSLAGGSMATGWAADPPANAYDPFMDDLVANYDATAALPGAQIPAETGSTPGFVDSVIGADSDQLSQIGRIADGASVGQGEALFADGADSGAAVGAHATTSAASEAPEPEQPVPQPSETTEFPDGATVTNPYTDANNNVYETRGDYLAGTNAHEVTPSTDGSDNQAEPV